MYNYINNFFLTKFYDNLPKFFSRKIFKIFKIFFVPTSLKELPEDNHPSKLDINFQNIIIKKSKEDGFKPFVSYIKLLELLKNYEKNNSNIKFYDFGPCNIDLYLYLSKKLKKIEYIYFDQPHHNLDIKKLKKYNGFSNLNIDIDFKLEKKDLDFVYFGSSIQYLKDYKETLKKFLKNKSKYIVISQTPFYSSENHSKDIVLKQINLHPIINFAYLINYDSFLTFMEKSGYILKEKNLNRVIKFINFKNFDKNYQFIDFFDLVFKYDV